MDDILLLLCGCCSVNESFPLLQLSGEKACMCASMHCTVVWIRIFIWLYRSCFFYSTARTMCGYCVSPVKSLTPWSGYTTTSAVQSVHHLERQAHTASSVPLSHWSLMFICKDTSLKSTYCNDLS